MIRRDQTLARTRRDRRPEIRSNPARSSTGRKKNGCLHEPTSAGPKINVNRITCAAGLELQLARTGTIPKSADPATKWTDAGAGAARVRGGGGKLAGDLYLGTMLFGRDDVLGFHGRLCLAGGGGFLL